MDWINLHTSTLDSPEFILSDDAHRLTWLLLLRYCVGQENGGRIKDCTDWSNNNWRDLCRVEKPQDCRLYWFEGSDLVVWSYPKDKEDLVVASREYGRIGGKRSGKARMKPPNEPPLKAPLQGGVHETLERNGTEVEGRGTEEERNANARAREVPIRMDVGEHRCPKHGTVLKVSTKDAARLYCPVQSGGGRYCDHTEPVRTLKTKDILGPLAGAKGMR